MSVQLFCGDCLEILPTLDGDSIDLTVTSPPYDNLRKYDGYTFDFEGIARELYRVTKPGGVVVWVVGDETKDGSESLTSFKQAIYFREACGFNLHDTMIYQKGNFSNPSSTRYHQIFEYMFVFSKGAPGTFNPIKDVRNKWSGSTNWGNGSGRNPDGSMISRGKKLVREWGMRLNVWVMNTVSMDEPCTAQDHPAMFPEKLAADHIVSWSNPGDVVLDPMMGSGTTGKMAIKLGRSFMGIECSANYFEIARRRIEQAEAQPALLQV